jgi:O-antigen ligase
MRIIRYTLLFVLLTRCSLDVVLGYTSSGQGGFSGGALINAIVLLIGFAPLLMRKRPNFRVLLTIWTPYLAVAFVSVVYAPDFVTGLRLFLNILSYAAIFFASFYVVGTEGQIVTLLKTMLLSSVTPLLYGFMEYAAGLQQYEGRVQSTFAHPNIYAFYIVFVIALILYFVSGRFAGNSRFWKVLPLVLVPLSAGSLLLTQTRSAWAAAFLIIGIYAIAVNRRFAFVLLAAPLLLFVPAISDRLNNLDSSIPIEGIEIKDLADGITLDSYAWRKVLWNYALKDSSDARVLGKGIGSFRYFAPDFFPLEDAADAHSGYVQALYETGVVGLALYLWAYVGAAAAIWRRRRTLNRQLSVIVVAFVGANILLNYSDNVPYYLAYNWYVWAFLGGDLALRTCRGRVGQTSFRQEARAAQSAFRPHEVSYS